MTGDYAGTLDIPSDDPDENPVTLDLLGEGTCQGNASPLGGNPAYINPFECLTMVSPCYWKVAAADGDHSTESVIVPFNTP